jgi:multidrug efflux pump subunit AcrA (membrane-fusion protein)
LGWFVSDRYQPEGKVCVYVFVPGDTKEVYDFDDTDEARLINVASLRSIRATWQDEAQAHDAQSRLAQARQAQDVKVARKRDFTFVVNDTHICYTLDDFHSAEAQRAYLDYARKQQDLSQLQQTLAEKRRQYAAGQTAVSASILDLETRAEDMAQELEALANQVRTKELNK